MPRRPQFSEEEQQEIVRALETALQEDVNDRSPFITKRTNSIEDWLTPEAPDVDYPWDNASNITPPIIPKAVRTVYPRIVNAFFGADPFVHVTPVNAALNRDDAEAREAFLNFYVRNVIPDFQKEVSTFLLDHIVHGTSILLVYWEQFTELAPIWKIVDAEISNPIVPDETIRLTDRQILTQLFGSEDPDTGDIKDDFTANPQGDHSYWVRYEEDGYEKSSLVTIDRKEVGLRQGQAGVTIEETRHVGRVRVRTVALEDIIVPAAATGFQPEQAQHLFRPYWLYPRDIEDKYDSGEYFNLREECLEKLRTLSFTGETIASQDSSAPKEARDAFIGIDTVSGLSGDEQAKIRVVESYFPWKVRGRWVEIIFQWIPALKRLAGWEYRDVKFAHRHRPTVGLQFLPISNSAYGIGLADLLANVQAEAKVIFNQMNNREDLINNPVMLIEQNAGVNPNVFKQLPPGSTVTVRNVERIRPLEWAKDPHSGLPILQNLFAFGEQLAGVGDLTQGVQPNRPNAPRTARGTLALISEGNIILDQHVMLAQQALVELVFQIDRLLAQYMPPEMPYTVTGKREVNVMRREKMEIPVKFFFTGNTVNTNSQQQQGVSQFIYQNLIATPFFTGEYLQMPQTSIISMYRLIDYFAKMHLPGKDASFILPPLEDLLQSSQAFQTAQSQGLKREREDEIARIQDSEGRDRDVEEAKAATGIMKVLADMKKTDVQARTQRETAAMRPVGGNSGGSESAS